MAGEKIAVDTTSGQSTGSTQKSDLVLCVVCQESIVSGARKCKHCHSFQGWLRRNLTLWGTVLPLLVALFSIVTSFSAVQLTLQSRNKESIQVSVNISASGIAAGLKAYAVHNGSNSATLEESAVIVIKNKDQGELHKINHFFNAGGRDLEALTLQPGQQRTFYLNRSNVTEEYPNPPKNAICELHYAVQSPNGRINGITPFDCW